MLSDNDLKGWLITTPLALYAEKNKNRVQSLALEVLPYSIGIEIECNCDYTTALANHCKDIKGIIEYRHSSYELRFRIQNGFNGLCSLYVILELIKHYAKLNEGAGIHYHVDSPWLESRDYKKIIDSKIGLDILDNWNYKGTYNKRGIVLNSKSKWINIRSQLKTIEYRIGEMTFDYKLIMSRIIDISNINTQYMILRRKSYNAVYNNSIISLKEYKQILKDNYIDDTANIKKRYLEALPKIKEEFEQENITEEEIINFNKTKVIKI